MKAADFLDAPDNSASKGSAAAFLDGPAQPEKAPTPAAPNDDTDESGYGPLMGFMSAPAEVAASMVTQLPVSALKHGIEEGAYIFNNQNPEEAKRTADRVIPWDGYTPQSEAGKTLAGGIGAALSPISGSINWLSSHTGASPSMQGITSDLLGARGLDFLPKIPGAVKKAGEIAGKGVGALKKGSSAITKDLLGKSSAEAESAIPTPRTVSLDALETESSKRLKDALGLSESKIYQAETAGGKASRLKDTVLRNLAGVETSAAETGQFRPVAQTAEEIGAKMRDRADSRLSDLKTRRAAEADKNFKAAIEETRQREAVAKDAGYDKLLQTEPAFQKLVTDLKDRALRTSDTNTSGLINGLIDSLNRAESLEAMETLRREIGDYASFGKRATGYDAIAQGIYKDAYRGVSDAMKHFSPEFAKYIDSYREMSKPIDVFYTKMGKALVDTQKAGETYYNVNAERIPDKVFRSPTDYDQYVETLGGDVKAAEADARRYFAADLEKQGTLSAATVERYLLKNKAVLGKMPAVRQEIISKVLTPLREAEKRSAAAEGIAKRTEAEKAEIAKQQGSLDRAFTKYEQATPEHRAKIFERDIAPELRKSGKVPESQIAAVQKEIAAMDAEIDAAKTAAERAAKIKAREENMRKRVLSLLGISVGLYETKNYLTPH